MSGACVLETDVSQLLRRIECINDRTTMEIRRDIEAELRVLKVDIINEVKGRVNKVLKGSKYADSIIRIFEEKVAELTDKVEKMEKELEELKTNPDYLKSKVVTAFKTYAFNILNDSLVRDLISSGKNPEEIIAELIETVSLITANPVALKILESTAFYQALTVARRRYSKIVMDELFEQFVRQYVDLLVPFIFGKSYEYWSGLMYDTEMRIRDLDYDLMRTKNEIEMYKVLIKGIEEGAVIENSWKLADVDRKYLKYVIPPRYSIDSIITKEMDRILIAVKIGKNGHQIAQMFKEFLEICGIPVPE